MKPQNEEILILKRLVNYVIFSLLPIIAFSLVVYYLSGSMSVLALTLYQGLNLFVFFFSFATIRIIEKSTLIKFPYGTGKLENFASFLLGAISIPACLYIIEAGIVRIIHPNLKISFGITQVLMILIISRAIFITLYARRASRLTGSPMAKAYFENFRMGLVFFTAAFAALFAGWLLNRLGHPAAAAYIDPILAIAAMSAMLVISARQVATNYRVLIDLPLPEHEQLKIIIALTAEFHSYEDIGQIYTRSSGKQRFIDLELYFSPETPLAQISQVRTRLHEKLAGSFPHLSFNLIPLCR